MIRYPQILKKINQITFDNPYNACFWKSIIERVSLGDAPFGTSIFDHHLKFRKSQIDLLSIEATELIDFFIEQVGLKLEFISFQSWKEIKKKIIKDNLIQDFVYRKQEQFQLDSSKTARLLSLIHLYITIKRILPSEIHLKTYPHMFIDEIDGIEFKQGNFVYISLQDREEILSESSERSSEYFSSSSDAETEDEDDDNIE